MKPSDTVGRPPLPHRTITRLTLPLRRFLEVESASGFLLVFCTALALVLANSPLGHDFQEFWHLHLSIGIGTFSLDEPLHFWVNDALMTLFFFVVGLEIKRELVAGELSTAKKAALPVIGAIGGMVVPAGIYLSLMSGKPGEHGWAIPMATDIAFVVGVLAVFGHRIPIGLKVFLLALAIVDDIGAILVIAVVYSGTPDLVALGAAGLGFAFCYFFNRLGVRAVPVYLVIGVGIWFATLKSGVHPTIAGVLLGLLTPSRAWIPQVTLREAVADVLMRVQESADYEAEDADYRRLEFVARESISPLVRLESLLHPWVAFVIMPVFALANAGVEIRLAAFSDPIASAVALGLMVGKPIGIFGLSLLAIVVGLASLPTGVTRRQLFAASCLGGIGFTMSLFIAGLGLDVEHLDAGKIGILSGSLISVIVGVVLLLLSLQKTTVEANEPSA